ncbi:MAG: peptide deformylase [Oligoflexia bacterium]|nr:peptide deformylase [Oligoflexia bacterium]
MPKREILIYPDPRLKQRSLAVDKFDSALHQLLDDMTETMYAANGVGLAAPQVGVLERVTVVDVSEKGDQPREFINPKIVSASGSDSGEEGCLSIPGYRDLVRRNTSIVVTAQDRTGKEFEVAAEGLLAICLQHEIDHLDGVLFVDRLSRLKRELFRRWLRKQSEIES